MVGEPHCQPDVEPVPVGDRCTGECCKRFFIWDHEQWAAWLNGAPVPKEFEGDRAEFDMIVSMIRPIPGEPRAYTCSLFDGESCTAYEARPRMCRGYPYGQKCEHGKLCAWDKGRRGHNDFEHARKPRLPVVS